jgi:hypothetical protein
MAVASDTESVLHAAVIQPSQAEDTQSQIRFATANANLMSEAAMWCMGAPPISQQARQSGLSYCSFILDAFL